MKKIEYMTPEMEVVELKNNITLLAGSNEDPGEGPGGAGDED